MNVDLPEPFALESGKTLTGVRVQVETWGPPMARTEVPLILVCHALTGDARPFATGPRGGEGWWQALYGPGRLMDPERRRMVCMAVLGGCAGTTGPASLAPETGLPYGLDFPTVTVRDMVRLQARVLDLLGVGRVDLVIGGSLGGMQALEWAETFPDRVGLAVVVAASDRMPAHALALNAIQRRLIVRDKGFDPRRPAATGGLGTARALAMITYRGARHMEAQFGQRPSRHVREDLASLPPDQDLHAVDDYLNHQARAIRRRFDAHSYLYLIRAMDLHDVGRGRPSLPDHGPPVVFVGISTDLLFPPWSVREAARRRRARGLPSRYLLMNSPFGHDSFLRDPEELAALIRRPVERALAGRAPWPRLRRVLNPGAGPARWRGPRSPAAR